MTADKIIAEGERLAKSSLWLNDSPTPTGVVAYWGGTGIDERDGFRHRISFDCAWLAAHGVRVQGSVGVYDVDRKPPWSVPVWLDRRPVPLGELQFRRGVELFGKEVASFPPIQAVCLYGGPVVDGWSSSEGLDRTDYDTAAVTPIGEAYQGFYSDRCPLYLKSGPFAVLGGWHAYWPDDEFYLPREMRLALWTFCEAEPWVEVFERSPNMPVRLRTT